MVNRINLKLFIMALGLLLSIVGVYMNGLINTQGKETSVFLVVMGIILSFTGAVIPIPSESETVHIEAPQITRGIERADREVRGAEKADDRAKLKEVEFLCPKCGAPVTRDMIFCTNCGRRIATEKGSP